MRVSKRQCIRNPRLRRKLCNAATPWTKLQQLRKELKQEVGRAKSKWVTDQCEGVNCMHGQGVWECVGELANGLQKSKPSAPCRLQKEDGTGLAESPEDNAGIFSRSFEGLYGRKPKFKALIWEEVQQQRVHEDTAAMPLEKEIVAAVKRLNLSSPGRSGVTAVAMKALLADSVLTRYIVQYVQHFWQQEMVPSSWEEGELKILPKKGDLSLPKNYRGIMLLEVSYKVVAVILQRRLTVVCESLPHESQCGFRPFRGCCDGIFSVRQMIRKRAEHGCETWVFFLDLVKAFDRVPREALWKVLLRLGAPVKVVDLLRTLHETVLRTEKFCEKSPNSRKNVL